MVVEDYLPLRVLVADFLTSSGFDVAACGTAAEALDLFHPGDADVLITDIELPSRPNGVELATIMRARDPGLAIVFLTNYPPETAFVGTVAPPEPYAYLQKSMLDSGNRLLEAVESALADSDQPLRLTESDGGPLTGLTRAQLDIARMVAAGLTNAEIAGRRETNQRAVERLLYRLFSSLGIANDPSQNPRVVLTNMYTRAYGYPTLPDTDA